MFDFLTRKYRYCAASAQLRIGALKLIDQLPAVREMLEAGELQMTVAANIQTFLNSEKKSRNVYSQTEKVELIQACLGKSTREAQKEFARRNPEIEKRDVIRHISETRVRIDTSISNDTLKKLNELRDLLSHVNPTMSFGSLIDRLAEDGLNRYSPARKAARMKRRNERKNALKENAADQLHAHEVKRTRYTPASERHRVFNDRGGCTFVDQTTGHRCGSKKFLQLDHIKPSKDGGPNNAANLRWMCGAHNRWRAQQH